MKCNKTKQLYPDGYYREKCTHFRTLREVKFTDLDLGSSSTTMHMLNTMTISLMERLSLMSGAKN